MGRGVWAACGKYLPSKNVIFFMFFMNFMLDGEMLYHDIIQSPIITLFFLCNCFLESLIRELEFDTLLVLIV